MGWPKLALQTAGKQGKITRLWGCRVAPKDHASKMSSASLLHHHPKMDAPAAGRHLPGVIHNMYSAEGCH
eukprot:621443-Amphidinium_carterae.1